VVNQLTLLALKRFKYTKYSTLYIRLSVFIGPNSKMTNVYYSLSESTSVPFSRNPGQLTQGVIDFGSKPAMEPLEDGNPEATRRSRRLIKSHFYQDFGKILVP